MGWMPTDSKTRFAMGLPTMEEHMQKTDIDKSRPYSEGEDEWLATQKYKTDDYAKRTTADAALIRAQQGQGYNQGGTVKDPRASRRMYAKGGPVFR